MRDGREQLVAVDQLHVGERFVVRPGDKLSTDGVVEEGESAVDASMLTGEPMPVEVSAGDQRRRRDDQYIRAARGPRDEGGLGNRSCADREACARRAGGQGARAAPGGSGIGGVRTVRHRHLTADAGRVVAVGSRRSRRIQRGRRGDRDRLSVRPRTGDSDRTDGRRGPRRPTWHRHQGPTDPRAHPAGDDSGARQDRHRDPRQDGGDSLGGGAGRRTARPKSCGLPRVPRMPADIRSRARSSGTHMSRSAVAPGCRRASRAGPALVFRRWSMGSRSPSDARHT